MRIGEKDKKKEGEKEKRRKGEKEKKYFRKLPVLKHPLVCGKSYINTALQELVRTEFYSERQNFEFISLHLAYKM
jgi:hypothetical protein